MKSCNRAGALLLLAALLGGCASAPTSTPGKVSEPSAKEQQKAAEELARIKQEYDQAVVTMRQGNYPLAIKEFTAFSEKYPMYAGAFANLGILHHKMNKLDQAEKALTRAVQINPGHAIAQNRLGMVHREMGRFSEALAAYESAIAADEKYPDPYLNLGILYDLYLHDGKKALQLYGKYQKLTGNTDAQVSVWITELKQRTEQMSHMDGAGQ